MNFTYCFIKHTYISFFDYDSCSNCGINKCITNKYYFTGGVALCNKKINEDKLKTREAKLKRILNA